MRLSAREQSDCHDDRAMTTLTTPAILRSSRQYETRCSTHRMSLAAHTVAVIGGTGRLGHRIVHGLRAEGARVIAISRGKAGAATPDLVIDGYDQAGLTPTLQGMTAVINAGPIEITDILAAATPAAAPLIAVGSLRHLLPAGHADRDRVVHAEHAVSSVRGVMLHPAVLYGDGDDPMTRWLSRWPVVPAPSRQVQPIHLDDAAACFIAALARWPLGVAAIDLVGPAPISQWQAYRRLAPGRLLLPIPDLIVKQLGRWSAEAARQSFDQTGDAARMHAVLGVTPRPFQP